MILKTFLFLFPVCPKVSIIYPILIGPSYSSKWEIFCRDPLSKTFITTKSFSFVQSSRGIQSHAMIRSHFLLKLTNQLPLLRLLPCFAAKLRSFCRFDHHTVKNIARSDQLIFSKISTEEDCIAIRSLKITDLWQFETHCSHILRNKSYKVQQKASTNWRGGGG